VSNFLSLPHDHHLRPTLTARRFDVNLVCRPCVRKLNVFGTPRECHSAASSLTSFSPGYPSRKALLAIKKQDAEPLTREDVQYDLLDFIFSNDKAVFTDPFSPKKEKVTFGTLYVSTISNSAKCSKVLKDKMVETPAFALELAKISLLTNVGRINTTMACESFTCEVYAIPQESSSLSRDEDSFEDVPSRPVTAED
jgi:hypothetical protein